MLKNQIGTPDSVGKHMRFAYNQENNRPSRRGTKEPETEEPEGNRRKIGHKLSERFDGFHGNTAKVT